MRKDTGGFTLIEFVIIVVILGIVAAIAIPNYISIAEEAREAACRDGLGSMRTAIALWYADRTARGELPGYPPLDSLSEIGVILKDPVPVNPYKLEGTGMIVAGDVKGGLMPGDGDWVYNESTGQIWPNSDEVGENFW